MDREPGTRPFCYSFRLFSNDYLMVVDESHVHYSQVHAMYVVNRIPKGEVGGIRI